MMGKRSQDKPDPGPKYYTGPGVQTPLRLEVLDPNALIFISFYRKNPKQLFSPRMLKIKADFTFIKNKKF